MDVYEATRSVFARIQAVDPANAAKIMGLLLIQDGGDKDMIRLAFGPEALLHSAVLRARRLLFGADLADDLLLDRRSSRSAAAPFDFDPGFDRRGSDFCVEGSGLGGWRPCLYFAKGYCKNGSSCRFLHDLSDDLALPLSPLGTPKSVNFLLQHQNDPQRARMDFTGMMNPGSRQIYLTFPADSTFREDDVSNYFSIYGPVQDVRIPYQQKRMFGFVTFLYSETVKLILAKGNPHFVCDARVLVKPYKEKGKVPDKKQQQAERWDFSGCITPTGMDSRDPYEIGSRTLRRQMDELELQQAIELQGRQFMGLQLLDFKKRIVATANSDNNINSTTTSSSERSSPGKNRSPSPAAASTALPFSQTTESSSPHGLILVNGTAAHNEEPTGPREDTGFHECAEFNLPESPFASPTRPSSASAGANAFPIESNIVATASALNISPFKSCFFQFPRFSSDHGAVGM